MRPKYPTKPSLLLCHFLNPFSNFLHGIERRHPRETQLRLEAVNLLKPILNRG